MSRSKWIQPPIFQALLMLLAPENAEALRLSMDYGLRIGDVLKMPTKALSEGVWSFKEQKTGKRRRIRLSATHREMCSVIAGDIFVFEHRTDKFKHRTRQAVYKDIKRLSTALGYTGISPHSARKIYAVSALHRAGGDLAKVQKWLNHSDPSVTALYALADEMQKSPPRKRKQSTSSLAKTETQTADDEHEPTEEAEAR